MDLEGRKVLVLGGYGLVGMAICHKLLRRYPAEIQIHSLRIEESEEARQQLADEAGDTRLTVSGGDIFALATDASRLSQIRAQIAKVQNKYRTCDHESSAAFDPLSRESAP